MFAVPVAAIFLAALLVPGALEAQPPPPMPRDRPPVRTEGTASLRGRVIDGLTGAAIARAKIRLITRGGPRETGMSDASGGFVFAKLPGGPYSVHAEKSGYLPGRFPTGATVRVRMTPLVLADGQSLNDVTVRMFRASAISGRVVDAHGDPIEFGHVQALRVTPGQQPSVRGGSTVNDIGEFRLGRLEPGTYLVFATSGRMGPDGPRGMNASEPASAQPLPTYFPGVLSLEQAQPITLERGQSIAGLELALVEGVPTVVTGTIVTADGQPVTENAWVRVRLANGPHRVETGGGGVRHDGTFRLELAPGEYVLEANGMLAPRGKPPGPEHQLSGSTRLTVGTAAMDGVTIVIGRGATVSGRVVFEGMSPPPTPPPGPAWVRLQDVEDGSCRAQQAHVNADWTFRMEVSGTCTAPPQPMFGKWTVKSVMVSGEDVLTRSLTFAPGQQLRDVQVIVTDRRSSMTFRVSDAGQLTRDYVVLVFHADKSRWQKGPFVRTYVPPQPQWDMLSSEPRPPAAAVTLAPGGGGVMRGRPESMDAAPGEYYVVAVDDVEVEAIRSVELLERLIPSAIRVTVTEGANLEVALRRVKLTGSH